jgi:hypothetical protein
MRTFEYQLLRYRPDAVSGEFANVGVIVFDSRSKQVAGRFLEKVARVSQFFPGINGRYLSKVLKHIAKDVDRLAGQFSSELDVFPCADLEQVSRAILAKDDSSLYFTETLKGLDLNITAMLDNLFDRMVVAHLPEDDHHFVSDRDVWTKVYKQHFERREITRNLVSHTVATSLDTFEFEHAWKNGQWNCFEPLNFDLQKDQSVKDKAYKWQAKLNQLNSANEPIRFYMLSAMPEDADLKSFVKTLLGSVDSEKVEIEIVEQSEAAAFADRIAEEMEAHG